MNFSIHIEGLDEFVRKITESAEERAAAFGGAITTSAKAVQARVKAQTEHPTIRKGVKRSTRGKGFGRQGKVWLTGDPARIRELGNPPHSIAPKSRTRLSWATAEHPVWGVEHPGAPAVPFFGDGVDQAQPDIDEAMDAAGTRIVQSML